MAKHDPDLSPIFQALSEPKRRAMLVRLGQGPVPVSELARPTGMALPTTLRNLAVLEGPALIATEKSARSRIWPAVPETLALTETWLAKQRQHCAARLDRPEANGATLPQEP